MDLLAHRVHRRHLAEFAMHVQADTMAPFHAGPSCVGDTGVVTDTSVPNDHHGRPGFLYLQATRSGPLGSR
jgi:hypothetical protein